jgi:hypothetical protein
MAISKKEIHNLINSTTDEQLLEDIFMILSGRNENKEGEIWQNLTEDQKQETLKSAGEIHDDSAWETQEEIKKRNEKWLK